MFAEGSVTDILAQIFGLYMIAGGLGVLLSRDLYSRAVDEFRNSVMLTYLAAIVVFTVGAVTLTLHRDWSSAPAAVISLIGWAALIEGVVLLAAPRLLLNLVAQFRLKGIILRVVTIAVILAGVWLLLTGLGMI